MSNDMLMLNHSKSVTTSVKDEGYEVQKATRRPVDQGTPPEIIMQQEQREIIRKIEEKIERTTDEYKREKSKIEIKVGKLEKNRHEKKKEFEHRLLELQRAKTAAQEVR